MKKVFLAVLAAGLFFACSNDTKDKAVDDQNATDNQEVVDDQPQAPAEDATADVNNTPAETPAAKPAENKNEIKEDIEAGAKAAVDITNAVGEQSKAAKGRGK